LFVSLEARNCTSETQKSCCWAAMLCGDRVWMQLSGELH
jgi:hypothetical protein